MRRLQKGEIKYIMVGIIIIIYGIIIYIGVVSEYLITVFHPIRRRIHNIKFANNSYLSDFVLLKIKSLVKHKVKYICLVLVIWWLFVMMHLRGISHLT